MTRLTILAPAPRWLVPIAAAGVVVIVATAVVVALSSNRDAGTASAQPPAAAAAAAAVADPASPADSPGTAPSGKAAAPAREYLRAMTTAIAAAPTDTQTGSYAFVYVKMWAADDTLRPPWRQHHRHRGVRGTPLAGHRRLRPRHPDPPARRAQRSTARNRELRTRRLGRRDSRTAVDRPALLAGQLNGIQPFLMGPQAAIRAVADVYAWHHPDRDLRAALLRVLCDTDGLLWQGNTVDRAGRSGVAISVDSDNGGTRDIAVFDEHTGRLLAHQTTRLRNPAGLSGPTPSLVRYVLYLETGRRPASA